MKNKIFSILYILPYSEHYEPLEYYQRWHSAHRKQHLDKMIKHYYDNRTKILGHIYNINNLKKVK